MRDISNNAVVYARYSSRAQTDQSIEGQLTAAKKYAQEHGYTIIHEYIDRAMTGRNDNRAAFQQMLSDTAKKQFSVIIVWKVDRFGRNREELTFNKYKCKKNGVRVEYVAENMPQGPEAVILESILEGMAEYYSLQLSQNVKRGRMNAARKHHAVGGTCPLGYKVNKETKLYEIDPETAPTIRYIFNQYASGMSLFDLMRTLNDKGYRTAYGKPFTKNSLPRILSNPRYYGVYIYGDEIFDEGGMPAIIDKQLFDKVQTMLAINKRRPVASWTKAEYLLSGKLFCGKCGSPMVGISGFGKSGRKFCYYACKKHIGKECETKNIPKDMIESAMLTEIHKLLDNQELLEYIADTTYEFYLTDVDTSSEVSRLTAQIEDADKRIAHLMDAVEKGADYSVVAARIDKINEEKESLNQLISDLEINKNFINLTREHILYFLEQFRDMKTGDRNCEMKLIDTFVNAIFVYDDDPDGGGGGTSLKIAFNYSGNPETVKLTDIEKPDKCSYLDCSASLVYYHTNTFIDFAFYKGYPVFILKTRIASKK